MRPDDPHAMALHKNRYEVALIVLGGPSGKEWLNLKKQVKPDVVLTANGATRIGADYWLLAENMNFCHNSKDNPRLGKFMHVFDPDNDATYQLVNWKNWPLLESYGVDFTECVAINRVPYELDDFTTREYGLGLLNGEMSESEGWEASVKVRKGTVGLQLLHLAGFLGCNEIHSIGWDMHFPDKDKHHWYEHPTYIDGRFRRKEMFVTHKGLATQDWWVETAKYLKKLKPVLERDGIEWIDHSRGLLTAEGVWSASP